MLEDDDELREARARTGLRDRIERTFATVPRPDPPLTEGTGPFNEDVEQALGGKTWDEVTPADAHAARLGLWLLAPDAFRYYLPAMLRLALGGTYVEGLAEAAFEVLVPRDVPPLARVFEERMRTLDDAQHAALAAFVDWYLQEESIVPLRERAAAYWSP
jgi:hypothetical protein